MMLDSLNFWRIKIIAIAHEKAERSAKAIPIIFVSTRIKVNKVNLQLLAKESNVLKKEEQVENSKYKHQYFS
jgi:hypothetical protein